MKPSTARNRLNKRRAWLVAKSESLRVESPDRPTYFLDEEAEALDYVLGILGAVGGENNGDAVADQTERIQRAKDSLAARTKVCTCARCPLHGTKAS
jgi:hypothetical protein